MIVSCNEICISQMRLHLSVIIYMSDSPSNIMLLGIFAYMQPIHNSIDTCYVTPALTIK